MATRRAAESTYAGIVRLVEAAQRARAPMSRMADRYALLFLAVTVVLAGVAWALTGDPIRAVAVLVVATPCPLILAVPVAIVSGLSRAAKLGILIKGGKAIETLARVRSLVIDKTGTLTVGQATIVPAKTADGVSDDELLRIAASLDQASKHMIAQTIVAEARRKDLILAVPSDVMETPGEGVAGTVEGREVVVGGLRFVAGKIPDAGLSLLPHDRPPGALAVAVAIDGNLAGELVLADELRAGTEALLRELRSMGIERIVLATGDRHEVAEIHRCRPLARPRAFGTDARPEDLGGLVGTQERPGNDGRRRRQRCARSGGGRCRRRDGRKGAAASAEAADVVLLVDHLDRVLPAIRIARRSRYIALESVVAGIGLSTLAMIAAAFGLLAPVEGALLQEVIDVAVIFNALRALRG